jgi:hypothetical protein
MNATGMYFQERLILDRTCSGSPTKQREQKMMARIHFISGRPRRGGLYDPQGLL